MSIADEYTFKPTEETDDIYIVARIFLTIHDAKIARQYPEVTYEPVGRAIERPAYIMSDGTIRMAD